jgi:DNA-binding transcriptional ArsR family regulator
MSRSLENIIFLDIIDFQMSAQLELITDPGKASVLLQPLRLEILRLASEPISASEIAPRLGLSRQRVNYHVQQLAGNGLLRRAGRRRRRNMFEQRYVSAASGFLLSPELLGAVSVDWTRIPDPASADYLLALSAQMQSDLSDVRKAPGGPGERQPVFTFKSQFRFATAADRDAFTRALRTAITDVIARHTSPYFRPDGSRAAGQPFRLVLGCYPYAEADAIPG